VSALTNLFDNNPLYYVLACFLLEYLISFFECLSVTKHCFSSELFSERPLLFLNSLS
jgi:hypothetical protein